MLTELYIENIALIDKLRLELEPGFLVLTGETGAGKSILIDSISFVLGDRASKDMIRSGESGCLVEALFVLENKNVLTELDELGISINGDDHALVLSRTLSIDGKSICRVNGRTVTLTMLKEISSLLIDICGQHQHRTLLDSSRHIELLDAYCDAAELNPIKHDLQVKCHEIGELESKINAISGDEKERQSKIELYSYQLSELAASKVRVGEEQELIDRKLFLNNFEKLHAYIQKSLALLEGSEAEDSLCALDKLGKALSHARGLAQINDSGDEICEKLESSLAHAKEAAGLLNELADEMETDPNELDNIETRLDLIYNLKRKYFVQANELFPLSETIKEKLDYIVNSEEAISKFSKQKQELQANALKISGDLHDLRKVASLRIIAEVKKALADLNMTAVEFELEFTRKTLDKNGYDRIEFLISANAGEPLKPLIKIASGGELSRIMLALKNVLTAEEIESLIFDEIDAGVSGRTAQKVAEKLYSISRKPNTQVLCVSHLPQLAAMADVHYYIEKSSSENRTTTSVVRLDEASSIPELARLMSGAEITEASKAAARELKLLSSRFKQL